MSALRDRNQHLTKIKIDVQYFSSNITIDLNNNLLTRIVGHTLCR